MEPINDPARVPQWHRFLEPTLRVLAQGDEMKSREVAEQAANVLGISSEARKVSIASGGLRYRNRAGWAQTHLAQAGLIHRPRRGVLAITAEGHALLEDMPDVLDHEYLKRYPAYMDFVQRSSGPSSTEGSGPEAEETLSQDDPQELMDAAVTSNRSEVASDLLVRVKELTPAGFERLVANLLVAMGYGTRETAEVVGGSGDGGIDAIISRDALGLDRVYMQAKRYTDNAVGPEAINAFYGALQRKGADRGVFITSSTFTSGARQAEADFRNIILIDGERLAQLMSKYGVGVETASTHVLLRINDDYFEEL